MKPRGRPPKIRWVEKGPEIVQFSPRGKPGRPNEVELPIDRFEALRLVDYIGLKHSEAARQMGLSRQTLERVLKQARKNVSDAIINGKIIRIMGGNFTFK